MAESLDHLITLLAKLPGIGLRSAERIAVGLLADSRHELLKKLVGALQEVDSQLTFCSRCGSLTGRDRDPCDFCTSTRRDSAKLCIVENPSDVILIEKSGAFRGRYHVLGARISPMKGEGIDALKLPRLIQRLEQEPVQEVIIALNSDVESDATASYLADLLTKRDLNVTRLAVGIPAGSGLAYADPVTLNRALQGRNRV